MFFFRNIQSKKHQFEKQQFFQIHQILVTREKLELENTASKSYTVWRHQPWWRKLLQLDMTKPFSRAIIFLHKSVAICIYVLSKASNVQCCPLSHPSTLLTDRQTDNLSNGSRQSGLSASRLNINCFRQDDDAREMDRIRPIASNDTVCYYLFI